MTRSHLMVSCIALLGLLVGMSMGCAHQLQATPDQEHIKEPIVFGKIRVWQEEPSGRGFQPELASLEFISKESQRRYRLDIEAASSYFFLSLDPGQYQVTRVIIQEGGFRSSAEVPLVFEVPVQGVTYVGEWLLQVGSPNFTRELKVTVSSEQVKALVELSVRYPSLSPHLVSSTLAEPSSLRSRLYESTPYPRVRWFNRHNAT